jgi:hypothetical protein
VRLPRATVRSKACRPGKSSICGILNPLEIVTLDIIYFQPLRVR